MKNIRRKSIVFVVIGLFLGVSVLPIITGNNYEPLNFGKITIYVPDDYSTIQGAIDAASKGNTIFVRNDTYYENVVINKTINLIGEDSKNTIIDGGKVGNVIYISSDGVNISEFTIRNSGEKAGIQIFSDYNNISSNNINSNKYGIYLDSSSENNISKNNITGNSKVGIMANIISSENRIYGNNISNNNKDGIRLGGTPNIINGNIITGNNESGITCVVARVVDIISNNITDNKMDGIHINGGSFNYIKRNNVLNNNRYGIHLEVGGSYNDISENNIKNNNYGIYLNESKLNYIEMNNFIENTMHSYFINAFKNTWDSNFWDDYRNIGPKIILGKWKFLFSFPWLNFDWNPAQEPYDIGE